MRAYKSDRGSFTNFYGIAFICNFLTYISGFLLALLIIKVSFTCILCFSPTLITYFGLVVEVVSFFLLTLHLRKIFVTSLPPSCGCFCNVFCLGGVVCSTWLFGEWNVVVICCMLQLVCCSPLFSYFACCLCYCGNLHVVV